MLTPFGKTVRKLRIDKGELLKDLAEAIGVSSAFLSSMETGRKPIPVKVVEHIADHYSLEGKKRDELFKQGSESRVEINIGLDGVGLRKRELATAFSRKFDELSTEEVAKLLLVLRGEMKG